MEYGTDWEVIAIIGISGIVCVMILLTLGFTLYLIIRAFKSGGSRKSTAEGAQETRLIQEIHHGLIKMENRVEALETLLLDDERRKRADFERELRKGG